MTPGAVIQARMGSTRLPGKALADIGGRPLLGRVLDRLHGARTLETIAVATTVDASDEPIAAFCASEGVRCHRGPIGDVLHRYVEAASRWSIDPVVRITGDCPFICPDAVDRLVTALSDADGDYAGYVGPRIGEGIDPFSKRALLRCDALLLTADEREHLALLVRQRADMFACVWVDAEPGLAPPDGLRLSVDEPADLEFARSVHAALPQSFDSYDLIALLAKRPDLVTINRHVRRTVPAGARG